MPASQEPTPFYIRTREGATFHLDTLEEALEEFISEDGYRLTLTAGRKELVIRRCIDWKIDNVGQEECSASLIYREV